MEVEGRRDRHPRPDRGPQPPEEFGVGGRVAGRHHRPVEGDQHPVRFGQPTPGDEGVGEVLEELVRHRPGGRRPGHPDRDGLVPEPLGPGQEPADFVVRVLPHRDEGVAVGQAPFPEPAEVGREGGERVRLVHEPADGDPHD